MKRVLGIIMTVLVFAAYAEADEISQLKQQVQALQQSLRSMQQSGVEKGIQSAEGAANVERIRREFQSLQGSFDAIQFKLQNLQESLNRFQQDTDARLKALEDRATPKTSALGGSGLSGVIMPDVTTEATLYQRGLTQVRDGNYSQAASTFREFLQKYPKSSFAGNSQYWLAECYYAQRDYPRAIKEYQTTIANYPKLDKIEKAQDRLKLMAPVRKPDDAIPLAPGAMKPKADLTPLLLNQVQQENNK